MASDTAPTGPPHISAGNEDQAIRQRVRELVSRLLRQGEIDTEGVKEVMRAVSGSTTSETASSGDEAASEFADAVRRLDTALLASAEAAHRALELVASRGKDITENDLKGALVSLMKLQEDCFASVNKVAERAGGGGDLRREFGDLAVHARNVGIEASARTAALMNEFASRMASIYREAAVPGLEATRAVSARMALLTSGIIAGVADALGEQTGSKKQK